MNLFAEVTTKLILIHVLWRWKNVEGDLSALVVPSHVNILENVALNFHKEQEIIFTDNRFLYNIYQFPTNNVTEIRLSDIFFTNYQYKLLLQIVTEI